MNIETLLKGIDAGTARSFVRAARHVVDALLIEAERIGETQTPAARDYDNAELPRSAPAGGWLSAEELRGTAQRLAEAVAAEKWTDGLICAFRLFNVMGGVL